MTNEQELGSGEDTGQEGCDVSVRLAAFFSLPKQVINCGHQRFSGCLAGFARAG
jgi:hypothetical protein